MMAHSKLQLANDKALEQAPAHIAQAHKERIGYTPSVTAAVEDRTWSAPSMAALGPAPAPLLDVGDGVSSRYGAESSPPGNTTGRASTCRTVTENVTTCRSTVSHASTMPPPSEYSPDNQSTMRTNNNWTTRSGTNTASTRTTASALTSASGSTLRSAMSDVSQPGGGRQTPHVGFMNAPTDRTERASARSDLSGPPSYSLSQKMPAPGIMPAPAAAPSTSNPLRVRAWLLMRMRRVRTAHVI